MSTSTKKLPKHEKIDYKKLRHGLSILEKGNWPESWREGMACLLSYYQFIANTVDSLPSLLGDKAQRDAKTWHGIVRLEPAPEAQKRHERLCKVRQRITQATNHEQRAYGDTYSREGLDALVQLNMLVNTSSEELRFPFLALRFHAWEYWNSYSRSSGQKIMHTLHFTRTAEDMLVLVNTDTPYLGPPIAAEALSTTVGEQVTLLQRNL